MNKIEGNEIVAENSVWGFLLKGFPILLVCITFLFSSCYVPPSGTPISEPVKPPPAAEVKPPPASSYGHGHYYPARGDYVAALPKGHEVVVYRGVNYYQYRGVWYRASGAGFVIVGPPVGIVVPVLPPYYATVWVGAVPYYYSNEAYYVQAPGGYMVVNPPPQAASGSPPPVAGPAGPSSPTHYLFIYPRQGQSEKQQADDRYACHRWAVGQTGYDPTQPHPGITAAQDTQKRADYNRAMGTCLEARGYSVK